MRISFKLNNKLREADLPGAKRFLDVLREDFGLLGTKEGCGEGECGACTIIVDGEAVNSCLMLACHAQGKDIITIEGLDERGELSTIQGNFIKRGAIQCGYCTPGMIMSAKALLMELSDPTDDQIRNALSGNICRCSGYSQIIAAVKDTARGGES
jgi:carbon-monoxide dehydrogenase small subunit